MTLHKRFLFERNNMWRSMSFVAGISVIASLCVLAVPLYLFQIYDRVLFSGSVETLVAITAIVIVILLTFGILDAVREILLAKIAARFESKIAGLLLGGELSNSQQTSINSLHLLTNVRQVISSSIFPNLFDLPVILIFLAIIFFIHPILGGVILLGIALLLSITLISAFFTKEAIADVQASGSEVQKKLQSYLLHHELIHALGLYRESVNDWGESNSRHLNGSLNLGYRISSFSSASKTVRQLVQVALIGGGAALVLDNQLTAGVIFATSVVGSRALAPIEAIVAGWSQLKQCSLNLIQLENRFKVLTMPDQLTPLPRPKGILAVQSVVYCPPTSADPILRGITGAFRPGTNVAIMGNNAAGKSTLARILIGYLEPSGGQVLLDGQSLSAWDPATKGMYMGYLPQQVGFFEATIRENIARMRKNDPPERAIEAATFVGIHKMIMTFPSGYDTVISETGFQPSGGQKQLLGLARAYYGSPSFVVLDEPNANLDGTGEKLFFQTLSRAKKQGITTVVVSQRTNILSQMDNVLLLKNGTVEWYGDAKSFVENSLKAPSNNLISIKSQT